MLADSSFIFIEQQGHLSLCKPNGFVFKFDINFGAAVCSFIKDNLAFGRSDLLLLICMCCHIVVYLNCGKIECHNSARHRFGWELRWAALYFFFSK